MAPSDDPNRLDPFRPPDRSARRPPGAAKEKYFSADHEPALGDGDFPADPSERRVRAADRRPGEIETLRDSIAAEPALALHADPQAWRRWLEEKRSRSTTAGNLAVTLLAAMLGGPLAVVGALMAGRQGAIGVVYAIVFGPVVEELLKQCGMMYLLEKKPYRLFTAWQFVFAALAAALVFATIENLVYIHVYFPISCIEDVEAAAAFRWVYCTLLHVVCAAVASLGLVRVWRRQLQDGRPAELAAAFPFFATAMVIHGVYNLAAMFVEF